jgi:hypothetical protein
MECDGGCGGRGARGVAGRRCGVVSAFAGAGVGTGARGAQRQLTGARHTGRAQRARAAPAAPPQRTHAGVDDRLVSARVVGAQVGRDRVWHLRARMCACVCVCVDKEVADRDTPTHPHSAQRTDTHTRTHTHTHSVRRARQAVHAPRHARTARAQPARALHVCARTQAHKQTGRHRGGSCLRHGDRALRARVSPQDAPALPPGKRGPARSTRAPRPPEQVWRCVCVCACCVCVCVVCGVVCVVSCVV